MSIFLNPFKIPGSNGDLSSPLSQRNLSKDVIFHKMLELCHSGDSKEY